MLITSNPDLALLVLRLALSLTFFVHGLEKLLRAEEIAKAWRISPLGVRSIGIVEIAGAASVFLGIWTSAGAILLGILILGSIYFKTVKGNQDFTGKGGWEFELILLALALAIAAAGPGLYSLTI